MVESNLVISFFTELIKIPFGYAKELLDLVPILPFKFKVFLLVAIIAYFIVPKHDKPYKKWMLRIFYVFLFYATFMYWV